MSKTGLDIRMVLRVFNAVRHRGNKRNDAYFWEGLTVSSDYDGYNLELRDGHCDLTIHFHNKYSLNSPNRILRQEFIDRITRIDNLRK